MRYNHKIIALSIFTCLGTAAYWLLVFTGIFPVLELVPGYTLWFYSFPMADFWIVFTSAMLAISTIRGRRDKSIVWGLLSASSIIFLALNALLFGINTGLLFILTIDEVIEIGIKIYFIIHFSKELTS